MTRQINNITGTSILIDDIGLSIPAGIYDIPAENYLYLAGSSDIDLFVDLGNFVIIHEGVSLNALDGKALIHEGTDYVDVKIDGNNSKIKVRKFDFVDVFNSEDVGDGELRLTSKRGVGAGGIYGLTFGSSSAGSNYYAQYEFRPLGSDQSPAIVPVDSTIVGITFTNDDPGVDANIQILTAPIGTANNSATKIIEWQIRNVKHAGESFNVDVNALDKMALFIANVGKNPDDPRIVVWLTPRNGNFVSDSDDLSQDFPSGGL